MIETLQFSYERWLDGVHCWLFESYKRDHDKHTRGPSAFTVRIGKKADGEGVTLAGRHSTIEAAIAAAREYIAENNVPSTLASRSGRTGAKRTVKLTSEDISLLERILARERRVT